MKHWKALLAALPFLAMLSAPVFAEPAEAESVGAVTKSRGKVQASRNSKVIALKDKDGVFVKDHITTGPRGLLVAKLKDDTKMVLGNNASLVVEEFKYGKESKDNKTTLGVSKGLFRFVSGLGAKSNPDAMNVRLGKLATIGVRGTHFGGKVEANKASVMLLKPEDGSDKPTAIIVSTAHGDITIDTPGMGVVITAGKAPSAPKPMEIPSLTCPLFQ